MEFLQITVFDPRHGTASDAEYNFGSGGQISLWPGSGAGGYLSIPE